MISFPRKCIVDTNVPKTANLAFSPNKCKAEYEECVLACVEAIEKIIKKGGLVLDDSGEIFSEYHRQLSLSGCPGVGDRFMKWVHDNRWSFPQEDRVRITKQGNSYAEFPNHKDLLGFDRSDRKFIAVANAHPQKPPILQATDSKWWGWKDALEEKGISVIFLCPELIKATYEKKMGA